MKNGLNKNFLSAEIFERLKNGSYLSFQAV